MKSTYFKEYVLSEDAKKGIFYLSTTSASVLDILAEWFLDRNKYPRLDVADIRFLSEKTGESADTLRKAVRVVDTLLKRMGQHDDKAEDLASDILSLGIIKEQSPSFTSFLARLSPFAKSYSLLWRLREAGYGGTPNLVNSEMSTAVKPAFDKDFKYRSDDITVYTPNIIGFAVVAHISLSTSDCPQQFSFQITKENLDRFIADLLALQKQMLVTESAMPTIDKKLERTDARS